ncbi:DNA-binding transcriptional LysR family regulator [Azospirillum agricola]|uniref:LysR family transcriptional regulator n=1 Tax=Azospirillum agricola TaxID=1720247 RepID=UPI001AE31F9F|nr:LysR family transcriptional regulator [Azospirillum agricola]MBP2232204.1 DNA-binding transcriptional LysR family regulator [Azospirillum agricola]
MELGLLAALDALLTEGSVTRAAERMNLSPPAMSRTLARIREAVGDPILVRAGRGMVPPPRAEAMRERVRSLVAEAQTLLRPDHVDLPALERRFTVRSGSAGFLAAPLLAGLRARAPRVALRFVGEGNETVDALRDNHIDLDIGVIGPMGPEVRVQTLYRERFVGVVRLGHPLLAGPVTAERFAACGHAGASRRGKERGPVDEALAALGLERRVDLVAPDVSTALSAAVQSDLVATVPRGAARHAMALGMPVTFFALPVETPSVAVAQAWHPRQDGDPAHRFLRETVLAVARRLSAEPGPPAA